MYMNSEKCPKGKCLAYYAFRDELSTVDGILFKGQRIVIPTSMRAEMLKRIHEGHLRIE